MLRTAAAIACQARSTENCWEEPKVLRDLLAAASAAAKTLLLHSWSEAPEQILSRENTMKILSLNGRITQAIESRPDEISSVDGAQSRSFLRRLRPEE